MKIIAGLLIAGAIIAVAAAAIFRPVMVAEQARMNAETAVYEAHQTALNAIAQQERAAVSTARVQAVRASYAAMAGAAVLAVVSGVGVVWRIWMQQLRIAQMPVARRIADGLVLIEERGRLMLVDVWTGRRALLSDAAGVDQLRAQITERLLVTARLAASAERIGVATRDGRAADALPLIGEYARSE